MKHLVKMYKKHANEGLVSLTICVNEEAAELKDFEKAAAKVLRKHKISIKNYLVSIDSDSAFEKFHLDAGYPCTFVFSRKGKWKQFSGLKAAPKIDALVAKFLKEKE